MEGGHVYGAVYLGAFADVHDSLNRISKEHHNVTRIIASIEMLFWNTDLYYNG